MTTFAKEYFSDDELRCKCGCDKLVFNPNVRLILNQIRDEFGKPMVVSSGYRCPQHPVEARKQTTGEHCTGMAVDISVASKDALDLLKVACKYNVPRLGISQKGAHRHRFIHLGWSRDYPEGLWSY